LVSIHRTERCPATEDGWVAYEPVA
jgi:hypothetical protein